MKSAKLLLFTIAMLLMCIYSKAQGNLQFNRAIFKEIICNGSASIDSTIIVPSNKVWKIESAGAAGYDMALALGSSTGSLVANAQILYCQNQYTIRNFPIWLPAGTYHLQLIPIRQNNSA